MMAQFYMQERLLKGLDFRVSDFALKYKHNSQGNFCLKIVDLHAVKFDTG